MSSTESIMASDARSEDTWPVDRFTLAGERAFLFRIRTAPGLHADAIAVAPPVPHQGSAARRG
jgi:uncharacterized membrane protein YidH (DUF202 family)